MAGSKKLSRRDFLRTAGIGATSLTLGSLASNLHFPPHALAQSSTTDSALLEVDLRATPDEVSLLPGNKTKVWAYRGEVLQGDPAALQFLPGSYLGPVFRVRQGQNVRIHFTNELPQKSIVHWHGLILPEAMDGHPRFAIAPGETYTYDFQVNNRAGTYWYHPHPHGLTGQQVYNGLAGLFIVSDDEESAAGLPQGDYDIPLAVQDRTFDADNQLVYLSGGGMTQMMTQMMGFLGNNILVNGKPNYALSVEARPYRLRVLNGSNFRVLKLGWDDGTPLTVIGTDGGLLAAPVQRDYVVLSPGERVELWSDFTDKSIGSQLRLQSLAFTGIEMGGMMGGMMMEPTTTLPHGDVFTILQVNVQQSAAETQTLPDHLSTIEQLQATDAVNNIAPRTFEVAMINENWTINGRSFEMDAVADDEIVRPNTLEIWEFVNVVNSSGMGSMGGMQMGGSSTQTGDQMAHPMHIHGVQFQVLERSVDGAFTEGYNTIRDGYVDDGWKDTVLLMPGERVKLLVRFGNNPGKFVYHCHNLEHEDLGLMRNYEVQA